MAIATCLCRYSSLQGKPSLHDLEKNRQASAIEEWVANVINYAYPKGIRGHVELTAKVVDGVLTLQLKQESAAKGGTLILTHVKGEVEKILKITGFNRLFDIR